MWQALGIESSEIVRNLQRTTYFWDCCVRYFISLRHIYDRSLPDLLIKSFPIIDILDLAVTDHSLYFFFFGHLGARRFLDVFSLLFGCFIWNGRFYLCISGAYCHTSFRSFGVGRAALRECQRECKDFLRGARKGEFFYRLAKAYFCPIACWRNRNSVGLDVPQKILV